MRCMTVTKLVKRAIVVAALAAAASPATAQLVESVPKSSAKGLILSAAAQVGRFQFENERNSQRGSGFTATVGYGFTSTYAVVVTGTRGVFDYSNGSYDVEQIAVGGRVHMTNQHWRWVPFIELGLGPRRIADDDFILCGVSGCTQGDLRRSGVVFAQTVGVSFYPARRFALTASLHVNAGHMTATFDGQELVQGEGGAQDMRLALGATWVIGGSR